MLWLSIIGIAALSLLYIGYQRKTSRKVKKASNLVHLDQFRKNRDKQSVQKVQKCGKCNKYKRLHFYADPVGKITGLCKECENNESSKKMLRI
ncbi:hypothetical protein [Paenibacillus sp. Marseille-Q4541]|uniref:hypothetical protein n=1 Tax=Paenibacillus sp. Marseille-Q4541 TaxID=2831522 RepID=UPI001BA7B55D|nr:hypothetical protein [Paenibacillus sp. Marseille-Q4541]